MKVISFINNKGGVGKTTLAINIAAALFHQPHCKKVLLVDADKQGSLRDWHNASITKLMPLICANTRSYLLSTKQMLLNSLSAPDYVVIDTPGKMSDIIGAAVSISDLVIIPLHPNPLDVWASMDAMFLVESRKDVNPKLKSFFLLNHCIPNCKNNDETVQHLRKNSPNADICLTNVHGRITLARCLGDGRSIYDFCTTDKKAIEEIILVATRITKVLENDDNK